MSEEGGVDRGGAPIGDELASGRPDREASYPEFKYAAGAPGVGLGERLYIGKGVTPSPHDIGLFDEGEHG